MFGAMAHVTETPSSRTVSAPRGFVRAFVAGVLMLLVVAVPAAAAPYAVTVKTSSGYPARQFDAHVTVTGPDGAVLRDEQGVFGSKIGGDAPAGSTVTVTVPGALPTDYTGKACPFTPRSASSQVAVGETGGTGEVALPQAVTELTAPALDSEERRFADVVNVERAQRGLAPLALDDQLSVVADAGATAHDIRPDLPAHLGLNCEPAPVRAAELGYNAQNALEVTTFPAGDASAAFASWKGSAPHYEILMMAEGTNLGVARIGGIWVALVGQGVGPAYGPAPQLARTSPSAQPKFNDDSTGSDVELERPGTAVAGRTVTLRGTAPAGQTVTLNVSGRDGQRTYTKAAGADGVFAVRVKATYTSKVTVTAAGQSDAATLRVRARVTAHAKKRPGGRIRVTGKLAPNAAGKVITVTVKRNGRALRAKVRTTKGGTFAKTLRVPRGRGTAVVTVAAPAAAGQYLAGTLTRRVR